jgi:DNA-binding GntR family transcriptional regulator
MAYITRNTRIGQGELSKVMREPDETFESMGVQPKPLKAVLPKLTAGVERGGLKDAVVLALRDAISRGAIPAGARVREAEVARVMGVSQSPVREALVHLEQLGMVVRYPNRGTYVAEIHSRRDIEDLTALRISLELLALEFAKNRITPVVIRELDLVVDSIRAAAVAGDQSVANRISSEIHEIIQSVADSDQLNRVLDPVRHQWEAIHLSILRYATTSEDLTQLADDHARIVQALRDGFSDVAGIYLRHDIQKTANRLLEALDGPTPVSESPGLEVEPLDIRGLTKER